MTSRILHPKSNIARGRPSGYSESEKKKIESEKHKSVFVYIRRSTTNKQELSLQRQEDDARDTIRKNGYSIDEVEYYIESRSAYDGVKEKNGKFTRKRTEFTRMLADIDKSNGSVTILAYEPSRLSRNQIDEMETTERLFGIHNKGKQKIVCVKFNNRDEWDQKSNPGEVRQVLLDCYKESLRTGKRARGGQIRQLRNGRYVYATPRGINRLKAGESALKTNSDMPYIIKAWEMKAENKDKREITKYLAKHGIRLTSFETYFRNSLYAGFVPDPETGEMIPVKFEGGKSPISRELFNRVQNTLGIRRVSKHQEGDTITRLLKWEKDKGKSFSWYFAKGKYKTYKSNAYGGFDMSEKKIVDKILNEILMNLFTVLEEAYYDVFGRLFSQEEIDKNFTTDEIRAGLVALHDVFDKLPEAEKPYKRLFLKCEKYRYILDLLEQGYKIEDVIDKKRSELRDLSFSFSDTHDNHFKYISTPEYLMLEKRYIEMMRTIDRKFHGVSEVEDYFFEYREKSFQVAELSRKVFKNYLSLHLPIGKEYRESKEEREQERQALIEKKEQMEQKKIQIPIDALEKGYEAHVAKALQEKTQEGIDEIEKQILALSESEDLEAFFERLPEVLAKTFELSTNALFNNENERKKQDALKVIELATFELNPVTKKELNIKLFPILEAVKNGEKCNWQGGSESNGDQGLWRSLY